MAGRESIELADADYTAAVPLEISSELAEAADDILREFAEDAGLSTALVVERSGSLVAGISSESDVTIEVISALVAGASGSMRALLAQFGETGGIESLHFGEDRLVYLREITNRFILVGVSGGLRPAGLVRQKAQTVKDELSTLLKDIGTGELSVPRPVPPVSNRSLREVAMERAAQRGGSGSASVSSEKSIEVLAQTELVESNPIAEAIPIQKPDSSFPEPREVLEPLDFGDSEIVIERGLGATAKSLSGGELAAFSPFEADEDFDEDEPAGLVLTPSTSVFELADDDDDDDVQSFHRTDSEADEVNESRFSNTGLLPGNVFEMDEFDPDLDEESEDIGEEINEMINEEDQESEVRSSGPFYF